ncbi:MAG: hypothetical protein LBH22_03645 [Bacteroidales bacterium]|jgi:hypothetical protein|nr:hypothetical protein [Bacteroidales bacterium]
MKKTTFKIITILMILAGGLTSCEDKEKQKHENRNISACGVNDPLQNIEWLREYCKSLIDAQYFLSIDIDLYKVIDKDEHIFYIYFTSPYDYPVQGDTTYTKEWRDCTGKIVHSIIYPGAMPPPEVQEELNDFLKNIEHIAKLFYNY